METATSSAVKASLRQRLTALRLARLRRSRPRFARHLAAPRPLHAALPCGGGRPQSSLTLAPPTVKRAYFSLSTVNLNRAKSKRYRQLQQRIAEAWFRHIFLPVFKNSGILKTTCQSRRFRNEQLSFSPAAGYVPENVYITNLYDFFDYPCKHLWSRIVQKTVEKPLSHFIR